MSFRLTPSAAGKIAGIIASQGGGLGLRIHVREKDGQLSWSMTLDRPGRHAPVVEGIPVMFDEETRKHLEGMVIDWVQVGESEGFGVYHEALQAVRPDA